MDWFERITGFTETSYSETRDRLAVEGEELRSRVTGRKFGVGRPKSYFFRRCASALSWSTTCLAD